MMYRIILVFLMFGFQTIAFAFSITEFERQEENAKVQKEVEQQEAIRELTSGECQQKRKNSRIAVIVHETFDSLGSAKYNLLFNEINHRLNKMGLQTVPQEELQAQLKEAIAATRQKYASKVASLKGQQEAERAKQRADVAKQQAEQKRSEYRSQELLKQKQIKAFLANEDNETIMSIRVSSFVARAIVPSGKFDKKINQLGKQISESNRQGESAVARIKNEMAAGFVLKAHIFSRTDFNPVAKVNEVFVNMNFDVIDAKNRVIANVSGQGDSYSGNDTISVALDIVQQQADLIVAKLYNGICTNY